MAEAKEYHVHGIIDLTGKQEVCFAEEVAVNGVERIARVAAGMNECQFHIGVVKQQPDGFAACISRPADNACLSRFHAFTFCWIR